MASKMKVKPKSWSEHLGHQKSSDLTISAYCERYHLSPGMFYYWKRKLVQSKVSQRMPFQEIEVAPELLHLPVFEIQFNGSAIIRIEGHVSPTFLRELIGC